ncbi:Adhesion G protein-coupled receptor L2 [Triplophysa tibetana]|uniref:Adhesion G protein-coupled receptor L2 n=1 Tax=Triplophysa tibetana TaxID=1572043 RepID=A0A5A9PHP7_9TELE|nr:Adhesion G protein-coupled receptor L2 [Triplophysa tibetana]
MKKTWTEAQRYCRENYSDLATVNNINDMNELKKTENNNQCRLDTSLSAVATRCDRKTSGSMVVDFSVFTDPCPGTYKYLNVSYECVAAPPNSSKAYIINTSARTWREAQSFCRQYQTDLTSVRNQTDNQLIYNIINDTDTSVWIGLFRDSWEWSDNTDSAFRYWMTGEPINSEDCTMTDMNNEGKWHDVSCSDSYTFVCHEDELILIHKNLSWTEAVRYCRENHVDLVSVDSEKIQLMVTEVLHQASTAEVWLGLRLSCSVGIWFWVNGEITCYQNWAPGNETAVDDCEREVRSGAVQSGGDHLWISLPESHKLNFICRRIDK